MNPLQTLSNVVPAHNKAAFLPLLLVTACILVYYPILDNDFMYKWDDQWQVLNDYTYIWSWPSVSSLFSSFYYGQYSPINQLMYTLLYQIFGINPMPFHLASLLLHTFNVLLVFGLVRSIIAFRVPEQKPLADQVAFCTTLLFAIHPLQVEAVAWISASKILVCSLFYLLAMRSYYLYVATGKVRYYYLIFPAFLLAYGGKEQAVTLPLALLWMDWAMGREMKNALTWTEKIPFLLVALLFAYITSTIYQGESEIPLTIEAAYPLYQRVPMAFYAVSEYIVKTLFPVNLLYLYPFPMEPGDPLPSWVWIYPVMGLTIVGLLWRWIWKPALALGLSFFLIHLLLVLHILPLPRPNIIADRYAYLSTVGILLIPVWYGIKWIITHRKYQKTVGLLFLLFVLYLGGYARSRTHVWHNDATLKEEIRALLRQREDFPSIKAKYPEIFSQPDSLQTRP